MVWVCDVGESEVCFCVPASPPLSRSSSWRRVSVSTPGAPEAEEEEEAAPLPWHKRMWRKVVKRLKHKWNHRVWSMRYALSGLTAEELDEPVYESEVSSIGDEPNKWKKLLPWEVNEEEAGSEEGSIVDPDSDLELPAPAPRVPSPNKDRFHHKKLEDYPVDSDSDDSITSHDVRVYEEMMALKAGRAAEARALSPAQEEEEGEGAGKVKGLLKGVFNKLKPVLRAKLAFGGTAATPVPTAVPASALADGASVAPPPSLPLEVGPVSILGVPVVGPLPSSAAVSVAVAFSGELSHRELEEEEEEGRGTEPQDSSPEQAGVQGGYPPTPGPEFVVRAVPFTPAPGAYTHMVTPGPHFSPVPLPFTPAYGYGGMQTPYGASPFLLHSPLVPRGHFGQMPAPALAMGPPGMVPHMMTPQGYGYPPSFPRPYW